MVVGINVREIDCPTCRGRGKVNKYIDMPILDMTPIETDLQCPRCLGIGKYIPWNGFEEGYSYLDENDKEITFVTLEEAVEYVKRQRNL